MSAEARYTSQLFQWKNNQRPFSQKKKYCTIFFLSIFFFGCAKADGRNNGTLHYQRDATDSQNQSGRKHDSFKDLQTFEIAGKYFAYGSGKYSAKGAQT